MFYGTPAPNGNAGLGSGEAPVTQPVVPIPIVFEYFGATGLSALGPVTQTLYRFDRRNARVAVDPRDAPGISSVPNLRRAG